MRPSLARRLASVAGVCVLLSAPAAARAQAGGGAPSSSSTPGICSGGGCVPRADCQSGATLCSPFPEHPGYDPNVEFRKGAAALKAEDYAAAQKAFGKVLYLAPTNADAFYALGVADIGLGDLKGGAEAFERALKWRPTHILAARELALTDLKLGQADKARSALQSLKARAAKCAGACKEADDLRTAIDAVEAAAARS